MSALPRVNIGGAGWLHVRSTTYWWDWWVHTSGSLPSQARSSCRTQVFRLIPWWINHISYTFEECIQFHVIYIYILYIYMYIIVIMACRSHCFVEFYLLPEHPSIVAPTCHSTSRRSNMGGSEWCAGSGVTNLAASFWGALSDSGLSRKCETC